MASTHVHPYGEDGGLNELSAEQERRQQDEIDKFETRTEDRISPKVAAAALLGLQQPVADSSLADRLRWTVMMVLVDHRFDAVIGVVIVINSVTIGMQASFELQGKDTDIFDNVLEHIFLAIYVIELGMRFFALGYRCLWNGWVVFDFVLVCLGVLTSWILFPILGAISGGQVDGIDGLAPLMVLRVLRILRLARSLRLLVQFQTLWMLVRGLLTSAGPIIYTFILMVLLLYVFACMGVELISKNKMLQENEVTKAIVDNSWPDLLTSMLTLMQFVTLDSVGGIYKPLIDTDWSLALFFIAVMLIVSVATMNLVTAVIVEGALAQAKEDQDVKRANEARRVRSVIPQLKRVFVELDEDESGTLSLDEVMNASPEVQAQLAQIGGTDQLPVLFELIDADGNGEVSVDEFCDGLLSMVSSGESLEFIRMRKLSSQNKTKIHAIEGVLGELESQVERTNWKHTESRELVSDTMVRIQTKLAGLSNPMSKNLFVKSVSVGPWNST